MPGAEVPVEVVAFVRGLDAALAGVVGDALVATYLHGSAVLGGFVAGRSDVDVLFIVDAPLDEVVLDESASALRAAAAECPGRGVELSIVTAASARHPVGPWPFLLHLTTEPADDKVIIGSGREGDPDLLMHYAVCRAAALSLRGAPSETLIGAIPRIDVLAYLEVELAWALRRGSEAYAVLNACRAWQFFVTGEIVSKVEGARFALERGGPQELIHSALSMYVGDQVDGSLSESADAFVVQIRDLLRR